MSIMQLQLAAVLFTFSLGTKDLNGRRSEETDLAVWWYRYASNQELEEQEHLQYTGFMGQSWEIFLSLSVRFLYLSGELGAVK
ncbi:hypothetical protein V6N12_002481 [Hibiscus sabdariffa]